MANATIDTRTFDEIYKSLNEVHQYELRERIKSATLCTEAAIRNWRLGHRRPQALYQTVIVKCLKSMGIITKPELLFPR